MERERKDDNTENLAMAFLGNVTGGGGGMCYDRGRYVVNWTAFLVLFHLCDSFCCPPVDPPLPRGKGIFQNQTEERNEHERERGKARKEKEEHEETMTSDK